MQINKYFISLFVALLSILFIQAQTLTGIWSGKISRNAAGYRGAESIEMQIYQSGKQLKGYSFAFKDTSRFVLFNIAGNRNKRTQSIFIKEMGYAYFLLPPNFLPCEKIFTLRYYKIGKTQYLSGVWTGMGNDTSCFPGEELLVVLQKIKKPDYPIESFIQKKFTDHILRHITKNDIAEKAAPLPEEPPPPVVTSNQLQPADRKLDIQQIIALKDTLVKITLYDNAVVDDDTVTVFVNKTPFITRQRISNKPLSFNITLTQPGQPVEIIMQAENLGTIPPNTAVMIIETAKKRYEVRLSAGLDKHAVVIITHTAD